LINYERLISREYNKAFDGHFLYQNRSIFYYKLPEDNARQVIVYHDSKLKTEEELSYLIRISGQLEGYTIEGYEKKQLSFGTMSMITNIKNPVPEYALSAIQTQNGDRNSV